MNQNARKWLFVLLSALMVLLVFATYVGLRSMPKIREAFLVSSGEVETIKAQEPSRIPEWLIFFIGELLPLLLVFIGLLLLIFLLYKRIQKRTEETAGASIPEQIGQLAKLKERGILSQEEFEEKKKELLSKM